MMGAREQQLVDSAQGLIKAFWASEFSVPVEITKAVDRLARAISPYEHPPQTESGRLTIPENEVESLT
jgi:hypothetical protein